MEEQVIPRREVLQQIARAGYSVPGDDQVDRWHSAGLLCESRPGRSPAYGYTAIQRDRLISIARILARLESKRVRSSEIAFWLCYEGARDISPELVCEHLDLTVRLFQGFWLRTINGLGRRNEGFHLGILGTAKKLGGYLARKIVLKVIPSLGRSSLAREVAAALIALVLHTSVRPSPPFGAIARDVRQLAVVIGNNPNPPAEQVLQTLLSETSEFSQLLRLDGENAMLMAVREIATGNPTSVYWAVELVARSLPAVVSAFPRMNASDTDWLGPKDKQVVDRFLAPLLCAMTATCRDNEYSKKLAQQVRAGNMERIIADVQLVKQWADQVGRTISFGKVSHESI